ncbi:hypothetical protein [Delftia acidovorans]|uniref:hypothetical protein n=1 Tax=Delftia acidovorans TaxID=80866 RepID=UPI00192A916C|nr:hypothetical protein [Delftia acidovorans]
MRELSNNDFNDFWEGIAQDKPLRTPDKGRTASFTVTRRNATGLEVRTNKGNTVRIRREAFCAVLRHLAQDHHGLERPCVVASSYDVPGFLGFAAKQANDNAAVVISYILPILQDAGIVGIDGNRPNRTWLL